MMTMHGGRRFGSSKSVGGVDTAEFQTSGDENLATAFASRADQLEYMADLILELNDIAEQLGCATLAGILTVARTEARVQARTGDRAPS